MGESGLSVDVSEPLRPFILFPAPAGKPGRGFVQKPQSAMQLDTYVLQGTDALGAMAG